VLLPKIHQSVPTSNYRIIKTLAIKLLSLLGWKVRGELPQQRKFILAVAPHTSNWDFFYAILVMIALGLKVTFLGKKSIFIWPVDKLLRKLGGMPIDRTHQHGIVGQLVDEFHKQDSMILGLAPEGTRSKTKEWKTGFLIIAKKANVPVVPVSLDFYKKEVNFQPAQVITGAIEAELALFKRQFAGVCAKNPQSV